MWTEQVLDSEFDVRDQHAHMTHSMIDDSSYFTMDGKY